MLGIEFVLLFEITMFTHVSGLAIVAALSRVTIREVRYGFGTVIATFGKYRIGVLPFGGFVKMKDSREESLGKDSLADAFDHQSRWVQAAIPLGGSVLALAVAVGILGREGWTAFVHGFWQIVHGALSPFGEAQRLLAAFVQYLDTRPWFAALAILNAKNAAFNLLPIPLLNGGQAIVNLLGMSRASEGRQHLVHQVGLWFLVPLWLSWLLAVVVYVGRAAGLIDE